MWIGFGNANRGDDAAGLLAAQRLLERAPAHVTVKGVAGDGARLLEAWLGFDRAVVIDAVRQVVGQVQSE